MKLEELFIREDATILQTMKQLDETGQRILFIAPEGRLQAVLTDGDLRKFLLRGGKLEDPVRLAANYSPKSLPLEERGRAKSMLERYYIDALPLLDRDGKVADVVFATGLDVDNRKQANIPVVVMAGGLGTRLYPYTKILPKPLIPVGEKPICELILERFSDFGCRRMLLVVNYKKNMRQIKKLNLVLLSLIVLLISLLRKITVNLNTWDILHLKQFIIILKVWGILIIKVKFKNL